MVKICVNDLIERSREEELHSEDMLHVWTKREMQKPKVLQTVRTFASLLEI